MLRDASESIWFSNCWMPPRASLESGHDIQRIVGRTATDESMRHQVPPYGQSGRQRTQQDLQECAVWPEGVTSQRRYRLPPFVAASSTLTIP